MTKKTVAPVLLLRGDDSVRVGEISKRRKFQTNKKLALHNPGVIFLTFFRVCELLLALAGVLGRRSEL